MYGKSKTSLLRNIITGTPPKCFGTNCFVALVYKSYFFQNNRFTELLGIRFSYKHCNFSHVCLLVKMASKIVTRPIGGKFWRPPFMNPLDGGSAKKISSEFTQVSLPAGKWTIGKLKFENSILWLLWIQRTKHWPGVHGPPLLDRFHGPPDNPDPIRLRQSELDFYLHLKLHPFRWARIKRF